MFHRGQHVVCVDDKNYRYTDGASPKKGVVYTVDVFSPTQFPKPAVRLMEFPPNLVSEDWFRASRFRPLAKLKVEDFTGALEPA